jgi:iron complex outermembrane recepter protein
MKKYFLFLLGLVLCYSVKGQHTSSPVDKVHDTILLKEIIISATVPFDNKQVEKFYSTNYFSTIDKITERLDGVSLIKRGAYALEPQLNGFSAGQLNVTIDGMKMFGACTDKMDPITSYIEPSNLKSITVNHGTGGGLFGNNIGGSIDMALQEPNDKSAHPFYTKVSLGYESVSDSRNVLMSTGYVKNKWQLGLNGVYRKNGLYTDGKGEKVPFSQFEKSNIHSVLRYLPDSNNSFRADALYDIATNVGYPALPMDVGKARAVLFGLEYQRMRNINLKAKIYFNSIYHKMDDSHRDSTFYLTNKTTGQKEPVFMRMDMPGRSATFGAYLQTVLQLNRDNRLTIKLDNYVNHSLAEMTMHMRYPDQLPQPPMYMQTWPDMVRIVTGLYVQNATFLSRDMVLNVNGRIDYTIDALQSDLAKEQFSVFNYTLSNKYLKATKGINCSLQSRLSSPLLLNAETGYAERMPTISERFGFYLYNAYDGYDYIGNPNLRSEKSLYGRIGFALTKKLIKINLSQSVSYVADYIMGQTNLTIPPMNFYTKGTRIYSNLSGAKLYSSDLQISVNPLDELSLFMLTKYTYGKLNSGVPLPLMAPLNNVFAISYQKNRWSFNAENQSALKQERINKQYGESKTPAFSVFNFKASYHLMISSNMFDVSVAVTNLLNATYYEHLDWGKIYRPGRSIDLFIRYTY